MFKLSKKSKGSPDDRVKAPSGCPGIYIAAKFLKSQSIDMRFRAR
jgi:hypothetical protein